MAAFEPAVILAVLKNLEATTQKRKAFENAWKAAVQHRAEHWQNQNNRESAPLAQLTWEAEVVEYVNFLCSQTKVHGNKKNTVPCTLRKDVPLFGPRFIPPSYLHIQRRDVASAIQPEPAYLRPINIIHPFYYPQLTQCPECNTTNVTWDGWTSRGARDVHGLRFEETALGFQMRCKVCESATTNNPKRVYCFATTNPAFWAKTEQWEIPRGIPIFLPRSAVTRELFDLIVELRPSTTSAALAENIQQLHLLEHHERFLEYLQFFRLRPDSPLTPLHLEPFKNVPESKWLRSAISDELITEIFTVYGERTRKKESSQYIQTLSGNCISLDNTFKVVAKAAVTDGKKQRTKPMKGGLLSVINERNEIVAWRLCQSQAGTEIQELLEGYKHRCDLLHVEHPQQAVVDNCCHVSRFIKGVFPEIDVALDVWHFLMRYLAVVLNGTRNPHRAAIAQDILDAIMQTRASQKPKRPAMYWKKDRQEENLIAMFEKWVRKGVWSAAAAKVHADQLAHVRKGCLDRKRQDIAADGSRIEGSHKGWNALQRTYASGIVVFDVLSHDFVLRRNVRIGYSLLKAGDGTDLGNAFLASTYGSHHISLVDCIARHWNTLISTHKRAAGLAKRSCLISVQSREVFGIVDSAHAATFGGLFDVKEECDDSDMVHLLESDLSVPQSAVEDILEHLSPSVDWSLFTQPLVIQPSLPPSQDSDRAKSTSQTSSTIFFHAAKRSFDVTGLPDDSSGSSNKKTRVAATTIPLEPPREQPRASPHTKDVSALSVRLPLPHDQADLTRSQRLFLVTTNIHPQSLTIGEGNEFFVFMELRQEQQWSSFTMNSNKWVTATRDYNTRLEARNQRDNLQTVPKNPRALIHKLGEIEPKVLDRLARGDFVSKHSGKDDFWRRHCYAVSLDKFMSGATAGTKNRKTAICSRCQTIMYPGPTGSRFNHKRGYCSDGVQSKSATETLPDWPQPAGIFTNGTDFDPVAFLTTLRTVYHKIVTEGSQVDDLAEYLAFVKMLASRTTEFDDGVVAFRLFDLNMPSSTPGSWLIDRECGRCLRLDCLTDEKPAIGREGAGGGRSSCSGP